MSAKKGRFSFGLRSLLLFVLVVALCLVWLRNEIRGHLVRETETSEIIMSTGPRPMVEISPDADRTEFELLVRTALDRYAHEQGFARSTVSFSEASVANRRFLVYYYDRWVRRRLAVLKCRYVLDYSDPIAQTRNEGIVETIEGVAERFGSQSRR